MNTLNTKSFLTQRKEFFKEKFMLSGPYFIPQTVKKALILFHGYGADGDDLFSLTQSFKNVFPNMAFFAPNAPEISIGGGYEWFSLDDYFSKPTLDESYLTTLQKRAIDILPTVFEYISFVQEQTKLDAKNIFISGFSQGGLIAAQTLFNSEEIFNGLILMSPVPSISINKEKNNTPVLLTRGGKDMIIPPEAAKITRPLFEAAGFKIQESIDQNLEHGISFQHIEQIIQFIQNHY